MRSKYVKVALPALLLASASAHAATEYWTGVGTLWSNTNAWSLSPSAFVPNPLFPPGALDTAVFSSTVVFTPQVITLDTPTVAVEGLLFSSGTTTLARALASPLQLGSGGITTNPLTGLSTLNTPIALTASQTWTANAPAGLLVNGDISGNNAFLSLANTAGVTFAGALSGPNNTLAKSGVGTLTLAGTASNPSLSLAISAGTVLLAKTSSPLVSAANTISLTGGTLTLAGTGGNQIDDSSTLSLSNATVDLNGRSETLYRLSATNGTLTNSSLAPAALTFGDAAAATFSGTIEDGAGPVALTQNNLGTFTLAGTHSYSGDTAVSQGTLSAANANALSPNSALALNDGATLHLGGFDQAVAALSGQGTVTTAGTPGTAATLTFGTSNASTTFSGILTNNPAGQSLNLTKTGAGTFTLAASLGLTGNLTISGGALILQSPSTTTAASLVVEDTATLDLAGRSLAAPAVALSGLGIDTNGALVNTSPAPVTLASSFSIPIGFATVGTGNITLDGPISGGTLTKTKGGTLTLAGTSSNAGLALTISDGTVVLAKSGTAPAATGNISIATGATLRLTSDSQLSGNLVTMIGGTLQLTGAFVPLLLRGSAGVISSYGSPVTISMKPSGPLLINTFGAVIEDGQSQTALTLDLLDLPNSSNPFVFGAQQTYSGSTTIVKGSLRAALANAFSPSSPVIVNGNLNLNGFDQSIPSLAGTGTVASGINANGTVTLSVTGNTATTFSGTFIRGTNVEPSLNITRVALVRSGTGTLTLTGKNSFPVPVAVSSGALHLQNVQSFSSLFISGGQVHLLSGSAKVNTLSLPTPGPRFDVDAGALILQYPTTLDKALQLPTIVSALTSGTIFSTTAAATPALTTLALVDNADLNLTTYAGNSLDTKALLLTKALIGDADLSGNVDLGDFDRWFANVSNATFSYAAADFNRSGIVDLGDFDLWLSHVGAMLPQTAAAASPVPEPASLALLTTGLLLLSTRRRRHRDANNPRPPV